MTAGADPRRPTRSVPGPCHPNGAEGASHEAVSPFQPKRGAPDGIAPALLQSALREVVHRFPNGGSQHEPAIEAGYRLGWRDRESFPLLPKE